MFRGRARIPIWADVAEMTFSAKHAWFRDEIHFDEAHGRGRGAPGKCKPIEAYCGPAGWGPAGLSEQITQSFFRWLGCNVDHGIAAQMQ